MEIREMTFEQTETRLAEIKDIMETPDANLEELRNEVDAIEERRAEIAKAEEERKALAERIATGEEKTETIKTFEQEERKMDLKEIRNSQEYINAFANYIKTNDDSECRALLSTNVESGTVAVPTVVTEAIQTAWDNEPIMALVKKTYLKGNVKIGFEISATGAVEHTEGGNAVSEEELVLGIATLTPISVKKWISVSDEVLDLNGEAFLQYIYSELGYQIAKKVADEIIADVVGTDASGSSSVPVQAVVKEAIGLATIAKAVANLSDEATNPVIVMNKLTYADFKAAQASANYGQDIFDGLEVKFNNSLPSYASASEDDCYAIVGDFGRGAQANFPSGDGIEFKFDDKVLMTQDLVRVLGRMYCGHAVVAPKCFTKVTKPASV